MSHPKRLSRFAATGALALLGTLPTLAHACSSEPYIGEICVRSTSWCPQGYVVADGRILSIREYTALFGLVGFTYGGDGATTFGTPDLRGRMTVGTGQGTGLQNVAIAQKVGQQAQTLTSAQIPLVAHTHDATVAPTTSQVQVSFPATTGQSIIGADLPVSTAAGTAVPPAGNVFLTPLSGTLGNAAATVQGPYTATEPAGSAQASLPADVVVGGTAGTPILASTNTIPTGATVVVASTGTVTPTSMMPTQSPGLGMTTCLAVTGLYPNRP
ncbi:phage tail protein [uncultured Massilia sp.]|uniref:phage tail protein n=1 Tax=uncultured Massilia sp. TaxID=169973 RepID=UPI0025FD025A|nr:tail fiber protein [uncultured Massilia sp.]